VFSTGGVIAGASMSFSARNNADIIYRPGSMATGIQMAIRNVTAVFVFAVYQLV
jgi:hypothetical protein